MCILLFKAALLTFQDFSHAKEACMLARCLPPALLCSACQVVIAQQFHIDLLREVLPAWCMQTKSILL